MQEQKLTSPGVRAYLAMGSNLGDRVQALRRARALIGAHEGVHVTASSALFETAPMYVLDQPAFLNVCLEIETTLSPHALLAMGQSVESELGRQRIQDKGPRTLDVDILLYDQILMNEETLVVPHPLICERAFVLEPLSQIAAEVVHPKQGVSIRTLLEQCPGRETVVEVSREW